MKLSPKQKEVIRLMREGNVLKKTRFGKIMAWVTTTNEYPDFINMNTFKSLRNNQIVEFSKQDGVAAAEYKLTELGKSIEL